MLQTLTLVLLLSTTLISSIENEGFITIGLPKTDRAVRIWYKERKDASKVSRKTIQVLFLHAESFSSQTWDNIDTLEYLQNLGYRVVAIDLPGHGRSQYNFDSSINNDPATFLQSVMQEMNMRQTVIVSPAMSGFYAIPYTFRQGKKRSNGQYTRQAGWVPISPTGVLGRTQNEYKNLDMPTYVIYGDHDVYGYRYSWKYLAQIPLSQVWEVPTAQKQAYLNEPKSFNRNLADWLGDLDSVVESASDNM